MPKSQNHKMKILYLMKILLEETDEEHPMNTSDLINALKAYNITAERKSLYSDVEALQHYGLDIVNKKDYPKGYYVASRDFELAELKLLVDVVQSAKFITPKKSGELIKKLENLASHYEARQLQRHVYVTNRVKTLNEDIYYNVDKIHTAISNNLKIRFQYYEWAVPKAKKLRKDGACYKISPWILTWDDENYYLLGFDEGAGIVKHYRVDKMLNIEVTDEKREGREHFKNFDTAAFSKKTFGMFGGEERHVRLRFDNKFIGVAIDRFGDDIMVIPVGEHSFDVSVRVALSHQFFGWISALGTGVKIISPKSVVDEYQQYLKSLLAQYEA